MQWHSFSDQSGSVFLHIATGETLSVALTDRELHGRLEQFSKLAIGDRNDSIVLSLYAKKFVLDN